MRVVAAETPEQLEVVRRLMRQFVAWHHVRHAEYRDLIDRYFDRVSFEAELAALPGAFASPKGRLLVATEDEDIAGCVALRTLDEGSAEMKRMFVGQEYLGRGIGKLLGGAIIAEASAMGFRRMVLDTGPKQVEAQGLYRALGFRPCDPYYDVPAEMRDWLVYMELDLAGRAGPVE